MRTCTILYANHVTHMWKYNSECDGLQAAACLLLKLFPHSSRVTS